MPLPVDSRKPWPPAWWEPFAADTIEAAAWYSGDPTQLANLYGGPGSERRPTIGERLRFWGRKDESARRLDRLHLPASSDIASASADLLFGEEPRITIPEAHEEKASDGAKATEDRLEILLDEDGTIAKLLEGAEVASGLGGVFLRPVWDKALVDRPILTTVHADHAVPEFRFGVLTAVTFWSEVAREGDRVWRHLERYEKGSLQNGLYLGNKRELGRPVPLADTEATKHIVVDADGFVAMPEGLKDRLLPSYVPNVRPNRKHRGSPVGRSDTQGVESFMDSLDETWTSWVREIRLAKLRLIVPNMFLQKDGRGSGASFDPEQEIFSPLDMDPQTVEKAGITPIEFTMRVEQHERTCTALFEQIVRAAGYSPQTFGLQGDGGMATATEVHALEGRSLRTTGRKGGYWRRPVEDVLESMLIIDREVFGSKVEVFRPSVELTDPVGNDLREMGSTLNLLNLAQAVSVETRVRMLHPEWDELAVKAEAKAIRDEQGMGVQTPTGAPGFGAPDFGDGEPAEDDGNEESET